MKITINRLIFDELHQNKIIHLPSIGTLWIENENLLFHNNEKPINSISILKIMQIAFNIDEDAAYSRYEFWRRAITVNDNAYEVVKIDDVAIIVIDEYENYNFEANPKLFSIHTNSN